jgi:hypothetical protein
MAKQNYVKKNKFRTKFNQLKTVINKKDMLHKKLTIDDTMFSICYIKGVVLGKDKHLETKMYGGGGGGYSYNGTGGSAPVSIGSTTTIHDKLYLMDDDNREHAVELTDWDVACREGHKLLVIWVIKGGKDEGPYVSVSNLSTRDYAIKKTKIFGLFASPFVKGFFGALPLLYLFSELVLVMLIYWIGHGIGNLLNGPSEYENQDFFSIIGLILVGLYIYYRRSSISKRKRGARLLEGEIRSFIDQSTI